MNDLQRSCSLLARLVRLFAQRLTMALLLRFEQIAELLDHTGVDTLVRG